MKYLILVLFLTGCAGKTGRGQQEINECRDIDARMHQEAVDAGRLEYLIPDRCAELLGWELDN